MKKLPERWTLEGGFVDGHTHLREPSPLNHSENFWSGTRAMLMNSGTIAAIDMSNTQGHETNTLTRVVEKHMRIYRSAHIPVGVAGGVQPEFNNVGEIEAMSPLVIFFKIYGDKTTGIEREYEAKEFKEVVREIHRVDPNKLIALHAASGNLEDFIGMIAGDLSHPLTVCHVNEPADAKLINSAKIKGWPVYAEVTPHHLIFNKEDSETKGWRFKMKPPLVDDDKREELWYLLEHNIFDYIGTDHAPHHVDVKLLADKFNPDTEDELEPKPYGVPNEFTIPLLIKEFYAKGLDFEKLQQLAADGPRKVLGVGKNALTKVVYEIVEHEIGEEDVLSGARYSPYEGLKALGKVVEVQIAGRTIVSAGKLVGRYAQVLKTGEVI